MLAQVMSPGGFIRLGTLFTFLLNHIYTPLLATSSYFEAMWDRTYLNFVEDSVKNDIFDFIIENYMSNFFKNCQILVGGGVSGSAVANRLSLNYKVLLLEAGGTPHMLLNLPIITFKTYGRYPVDWLYKTVPQEASSKGLNNNQSVWTSARVFGGGSSINGMIYTRGTVQGYDEVAKVTGDDSWRMDNVLKYFMKIEDYHGRYSEEKHGKGGPLKIGSGYLQPFIENYLKAGQELGYNIRDQNKYGPLTEGFTPIDLYTTQGRRWDTYDGVIKPIYGKRDNLVIRKFAYVYEVIFDEENRAIGVKYFQHGESKTAKCSKEVILSAGAIQSAKILLLSGIGPKHHLDEIGIKTKVNLPVGENLMDKYGAFLGPFMTSEGMSFLMERDVTDGVVLDYLMHGKGLFTSSMAEGMASVLSDSAKSRGQTVPDIEIYTFTQSVDSAFEDDFHRLINARPEVLAHFAKARGIDSFFQFVTLLKTVGTGTLRLIDSNPDSKPLLDPKYMQNPIDVQALIEGIKFAVKIVEETKSFAKINGSLLADPLPGCENFEFKSDEYWECYGRSVTITAYKYCSTAPMGKDTSDPIAVVDSKLRVFGTKGLRVVDASVLREKYVSINEPNCLAVGEIGSDFILDEWENEI